jgi:hypothetical protein
MVLALTLTRQSLKSTVQTASEAGRAIAQCSNKVATAIRTRGKETVLSRLSRIIRHLESGMLQPDWFGRLVRAVINQPHIRDVSEITSCSIGA